MKRYEIPYPASAYTFPQDAHIHQVRFDDVHIHIELTDGRILSVPLKWIPTLYHALLMNAKSTRYLQAEQNSYGIQTSAILMMNSVFRTISVLVENESEEGRFGN